MSFHLLVSIFFFIGAILVIVMSRINLHVAKQNLKRARELEEVARQVADASQLVQQMAQSLFDLVGAAPDYPPSQN